MTNPLEPNDLSHLSDEQFRALCPLGEHAPGPEPLSPAAQAVLDAAEDDCIHPVDRHRIAAAALRAAADQVVPKTPPPKFAPHYEEGIWDGKDDAREQLLAIAAELEGADQATSSTH